MLVHKIYMLEKFGIMGNEKKKETDGCLLNIVSNRRKIQVPMETVEYVESSGRKLILHLKEKEVCFYAKLSEVDSFLKKQGFVRIHQSFMVRKNQIKKVHRNYVEYGEYELPVSRRYFPELRTMFAQENNG